jgi:hypothetical protein
MVIKDGLDILEKSTIFTPCQESNHDVSRAALLAVSTKNNVYNFYV